MRHEEYDDVDEWTPEGLRTLMDAIDDYVNNPTPPARQPRSAHLWCAGTSR